MRRLQRIVGTALLALAAGGCGGGAVARPAAIVFAAASLTAPFEALAAAFERGAAGSAIELHCAGTPQLVVQLREGAPADVFASADATNMERAVAVAHAIGAPVVFAHNRLAIAVRAGNPTAVRGLADLARPELRVVLCGGEVPAGRYAREILARAGVSVQSVSDEPSVKAVVAKVQLGEVDAGIVYATDVAAVRGVDAVAIPPAQNVVASYPIVALDRGAGGGDGAAFVAFVLSPAGQRILNRFGFESP